MYDPLNPPNANEAEFMAALAEWDEERERSGRARRPRLAEFDYVGRHAYHLVIVTHHRAAILVGDLAIATGEHLIRTAAATGFELLVYTIMPDHVHVLAHGATDDADLKRFMQRFKQLSSHAHKRRAQGRQLWQQSFFDRTLRRDDDVQVIARYVIENPMRAGLIAAGEDWPHQGGTMLAGG